MKCVGGGIPPTRELTIGGERREGHTLEIRDVLGALPDDDARAPQDQFGAHVRERGVKVGFALAHAHQAPGRHGEPYDRVRASAIVADGLGRERADLVVLSARAESRGEGRGDHLARRDAPEARAGVGLAVELEQPVDPSVGEVGGGLPPPPQ